MTADELRRHVAFKMANRELPDWIGADMLEQLNDGAEPDYQALYRAACWGNPSMVLFHVADRANRATIQEHGLLPGGRHHAEHWGPVIGELHQAEGVYLAESSDPSRWAHWPAWDVWAVHAHELELLPDLLNPRCWYIPALIEPHHLVLVPGP